MLTRVPTIKIAGCIVSFGPVFLVWVGIPSEELHMANPGIRLGILPYHTPDFLKYSCL